MISAYDFSRIACVVNALLAFISNGFLIVLILRKSPKSMENYKHLMLLFSISGITFGFIDLTNQPMLHFYDGAYVIFSRNPLGLPRTLAFWYLTLNCSCYGMVLVLLTFHFIYRYLAVGKVYYLKIFSHPTCWILVVIFIAIGLEWLIVGVWLAGESEVVDEHIRETMLNSYGLNKNDYVYASSIFYKTDKLTGEIRPSLPDLLFVSNITTTITMAFSIILFCWFRIRSRLLESTRQNHFSTRTLSMQRDLLRALVAQTLFPVFLMIIPACTLLIVPVFRLEIGEFKVVIITVITTAPFMDSLVPMYFVKDYRQTILRCFKRGNSRETLGRVSSNLMARSFSSQRIACVSTN